MEKIIVSHVRWTIGPAEHFIFERGKFRNELSIFKRNH